jgi:hypothetical protein
MTALIAGLALSVAFFAGVRVAAASAELDFPDAEENGPELTEPAPRLLAAPVVVRHIPMEPAPRLLAAPVVVRHIPMGERESAAKPAAPAPAPTALADVESSDDEED